MGGRAVCSNYSLFGLCADLHRSFGWDCNSICRCRITENGTRTGLRQRDSWIRPYLALGIGVSHLTSSRTLLIASNGTPALPPKIFSSTGPVLRSHVGIDLKLKPKLYFRYSFSETIGHNEISKNLSPPGPRKLANFQNLFGFVVRF